MNQFLNPKEMTLTKEGNTTFTRAMVLILGNLLILFLKPTSIEVVILPFVMSILLWLYWKMRIVKNNRYFFHTLFMNLLFLPPFVLSIFVYGNYYVVSDIVFRTVTLVSIIIYSFTIIARIKSKLKAWRSIDFSNMVVENYVTNYSGLLNITIYNNEEKNEEIFLKVKNLRRIIRPLGVSIIGILSISLGDVIIYNLCLLTALFMLISFIEYFINHIAFFCLFMHNPQTEDLKIMM